MTGGAGAIDVVIPVWNGARFLAAAIESALAQERVAAVIVVDDGSSDESLRVAERFGAPVRAIAALHAGAAAARNRGLAETNAPLIIFLDADDVFEPDAFARLGRALEQDAEAEIAAGRSVEFIDPGMPREQAARYLAHAEPVRALVAGTMLIRRPVFTRIGVLDPQLAAGEIVEWSIRVRDAGVKIAEVGDVVLRRRIHGANTTLTTPDLKSSYLRILRERMNRQRGAKPAGGAGPER